MQQYVLRYMIYYIYVYQRYFSNFFTQYILAEGNDFSSRTLSIIIISVYDLSVLFQSQCIWALSRVNMLRLTCNRYMLLKFIVIYLVLKMTNVVFIVYLQGTQAFFVTLCFMRKNHLRKFKKKFKLKRIQQHSHLLIEIAQSESSTERKPNKRMGAHVIGNVFEQILWSINYFLKL